MDLFNQLTVGLKKQQQLKVEFVESLTELQLLKVGDKWLLAKGLFYWGRFSYLGITLHFISSPFGG